jgi:hypothetical protein
LLKSLMLVLIGVPVFNGKAKMKCENTWNQE